MNQDYDYLFKLLLIGRTAVGKSSILERFANNSFSRTQVNTIGVDFRIRTIQSNGARIKLQIWDTAGQERFRTIVSSYYKGANGVILTYDITSQQSFKEVQDWLAQIDQYCDERIIRLLIEADRKVTTEQGRKLAQSLNMKFIETSAKDATNINKIFITLANEIKQQADLNRNKKAIYVPIGPPILRPKNKNLCC